MSWSCLGVDMAKTINIYVQDNSEPTKRHEETEAEIMDLRIQYENSNPSIW